MKANKCCLGVLAVCTLGICTLQAQETIQSDRPGQAFSSYAVPVRTVQLQAGFYNNTFGTRDFEDVGDVRFREYGLETTVRLGILNRVDMHVTADAFLDSRKSIPFPGTNVSPVTETNDPEGRIRPLTVGGRYHLADQRGLLPSTALIVQWYTPFASRELEPPDGSFEFRLATQHVFAKERLSFSFNAATIPLIEDPTHRIVTNLGVSVSKRVGLFVEYFSDYRNDVWDHQYDGGATYLLSDQVQLDAFGGVSQWEEDFFWIFGSLGISARF
ncbi:MAG: transporter [Leptolyngbya sp. SIO3F4]|nr:transporter [Leptolyngbya sp. SIO3F4]